MYGSLDISTSSLVAHRTWLTVTSANLANKQTILNAQGEYEPFRRRVVEFAPGDGAGNSLGVHVASIAEDQGPLLPRHEPGSPYADEDGYVYYPNVDSVTEQMNAMIAARGYEASIAAIEATKSMLSTALEVLA